MLRQASHLDRLALPGITLGTSPTDYEPIKTMRLRRFNGRSWELLEATQ
jgi:branched-chain amino acid transport system substrate-binding protein